MISSTAFTAFATASAVPLMVTVLSSAYNSGYFKVNRVFVRSLHKNEWIAILPTVIPRVLVSPSNLFSTPTRSIPTKSRPPILDHQGSSLPPSSRATWMVAPVFWRTFFVSPPLPINKPTGAGEDFFVKLQIEAPQKKNYFLRICTCFIRERESRQKTTWMTEIVETWNFAMFGDFGGIYGANRGITHPKH